MITIGICTKDRPDTLKQNLSHLSNHLSHNRKGFEILITDQSQGFHTQKVVEDFTKRNPAIQIKYFKDTKRGISLARNKVFKLAKGETIGFIDDDIFVSRNWFKELKRALRKYPRAAIIGGKVLPLNKSSLNKIWIKALLENGENWCLAIINKGDKPIVLKDDFLLATANLIIRKKFIKRIGYFDSNFANSNKLFSVFGGEDIDFIMRALEKNLQVVYYPNLVVYHKILLYKLNKNYFRKRFFESGKEIAMFDNKHHDRRSILIKSLDLLKIFPFHIRRTVSQYIFARPRNFYHEARVFFSLGYFLGLLYISLNKLIPLSKF